jgi:hypothetical protein
MSDIDSDSDSISDSSNAYSDDEDGDESLILVPVHELCNQLRTNDPRILSHNSVFEVSIYIRFYSESESIAVFQALKENTSVTHIDLSKLDRHYTKRSALAAAEYVESSKTLQTLDWSICRYHFSHEVRENISIVLRALSRNTSVTELIIKTDVVKFASVAFQELLTSTQTLQTMAVIFGQNEELDEEWDEYEDEEFDEVQIAAITSGFANNTTLSDLEFQGWREADLAPVLTALQDHPALQKIHFGASEKSVDYLPSLSGLEVLLRSQDSKVKELILERVNTDTVGLHPVLQELGRNTKVTALSVRYSELTRENVQQVKSMLRQNTALQYLDLTLCALGSAGLAEIAPVLYRNTSIFCVSCFVATRQLQTYALLKMTLVAMLPLLGVF